MTDKRPVNPATLCEPVGFAHAWLVTSNDLRTLYLAGQCGLDGEGLVESRGDLVAQLNKALANIGEVLKDAEMEFSDIVQLTFFVCSRDDYAIARREFGEVWRNHGGKHYPAMAVLMVAGLFDPHALIEVQGIAAAAG